MFEKNLEFIDNLALKRRLAKLSIAESRIGVSYCVTPTNDYVLLKDELPTDDLQNPRLAVNMMLKDNIKQEMKPSDTIITFGIGLGYLLDETFNKYPSRIYIYEPDLSLLHFVLNNVDISEHLSSGRVFITNDLDELISKLNATFLTKDKVEIVYLQNYAVAKNKELLMLTQKVFETCKSKLVDVNTITKFSKYWLNNTLDNISYINNSDNVYLLSDLNKKFIGQTALIAAAGPSLNDNLNEILLNRHKYVIFAVNKSASYLIKSGIVPDFIVCLDARNMSRTLAGTELEANNVNIIADVRTDKDIVLKGFKKIFFNFSEADSLMKKLVKNNKFLEFSESGGSASTLALTAAIKMGFSKIIMAGVDLAFKDNIIYAYGETMNRLSQNEILVDKVKKNIVQVESVNNTPVFTREDYQVFITHFESIIKENNYNEIYNISSFGAKINGVKNVAIKDINVNSERNLQALNSLNTFNLDIQEFVNDEFCSINNIISIISKGIFSPALVNSIMKSVLVSQYMQTEILNVLQKNFDPNLAQSFIETTKTSIKSIVEILQKNKMV